MYIITPMYKELLESIELKRIYPTATKLISNVYDSRNQPPLTKEGIKDLIGIKTNNIVAIIQARMGSTRLPNKTLELIEERPLLYHVIERIKSCQKIHKIVIATSTNKKDDVIENFANENDIELFRGSEEDVLDRFYQTAKKFNAALIVRVTADDPFKDPNITDRIVSELINNKKLDYVSNTVKPTFPEGIDIEAFRFKALETAWKEAKTKEEREHVTPYIWKNPRKFRIKNISNKRNLSFLRWTIDYEEDLKFAKEVYKRLYKNGEIFCMEEILKLLEKEPSLIQINKNIEQRNWNI